MNQCEIAGCESNVLAKGMCTKHYQRVKKYGDPEKVITDFNRAHYKGSVFHVVDNVVFVEMENTEAVFEIDKETFEKHGLHKYTFRQDKDGYAKTWIDGEQWFAHQIVLGKQAGLVGDHIDGDVLNNRCTNLRSVSHQQNAFNRKRTAVNRSGVPGVVHSSRTGRPWRASLKVGGKNVLSRHFSKFEDAVKARKEAEEKFFGEYQRINP